MLRTHLGYSAENDANLPVNVPEAISIYQIEWKFNLVIRNNSEFDAYDIEIFNAGLKNGNLKFNSKVSPNKPLPKHGEIVIPFEFLIIKKSPHKNVRLLETNEPEEFSELEILLNYCNSQRRRFNTSFEMKTRKNNYKSIDMKRFKEV